MNVREIWCDDCSGCAVEVEHGALGEDLDGRRCTCQSCGIPGKITWQDDADEDGVYTIIRFRPEKDTDI
jgi:hypothetical protein